MVRVCNADQFVGALTQVLTEQVRNAVFCDDVVRVGSRRHHSSAYTHN